jgi:hypothetical protein
MLRRRCQQAAQALLPKTASVSSTSSRAPLPNHFRSNERSTIHRERRLTPHTFRHAFPPPSTPALNPTVAVTKAALTARSMYASAQTESRGSSSSSCYQPSVSINTLCHADTSWQHQGVLQRRNNCQCNIVDEQCSGSAGWQLIHQTDINAWIWTTPLSSGTFLMASVRS